MPDASAEAGSCGRAIGPVGEGKEEKLERSRSRLRRIQRRRGERKADERGGRKYRRRARVTGSWTSGVKRQGRWEAVLSIQIFDRGTYSLDQEVGKSGTISMSTRVSSIDHPVG